jgi:hypothetical protein
MTEDEWLKGEDPGPMLEFLDQETERKMRLFMVGCCRRTWHLIPDERCRNVIDVGERFADGQVGDQELALAFSEMNRLVNEVESISKGAYSIEDSWRRAVWPRPRTNRRVFRSATFHLAARATGCDFLLDPPPNLTAFRAEQQAQADLIRCIMGNPFRPVSPGPWITPAAVTVAQDIYDRRDFTALPLLADLLEEAGCPDQGVLDHCRGPGEHARGCWVVDLVLGKG